MRPLIRACLLTVSLASLSACVYDPGYTGVVRSDRVYGPEASRAREAYDGRVVAVRDVVVGRGRSGAGVVLGAIVGGVIGAQFGGGSGRALSTLGGAVAGGALGDRAEYESNRRWGTEITVRLDRGDQVVIAQDAGDDIRPGDRVRVVGWASGARVVRD